MMRGSCVRGRRGRSRLATRRCLSESVPTPKLHLSGGADEDFCRFRFPSENIGGGTRIPFKQYKRSICGLNHDQLRKLMTCADLFSNFLYPSSNFSNALVGAPFCYTRGNLCSA